MITRTLVSILALILFGCTASRNVQEPTEYVLLDTLEVIAKAGSVDSLTYRKTTTRVIDLLHTQLDVIIDWENSQIHGIARLDLTPYSKAVDNFQLDAADMQILDVKDPLTGKGFGFSYDGSILDITLPGPIKPGDIIHCEVRYIANPSKTARRGDKGLYFIDPLDTIQDLPRQIWTQGETEHNSRWFPTVDEPNERCTQEVIVTVDQNFETLSNGVLVSSTLHPDSTRTDHWKMDLPHAPYLFALVVGNFDVVTEPWEDIEVAYYVDPGYGPSAKHIFSNTPEMLSFFSERLGFPYPWSRYAQVVVKNFVSGAMENTTAVIFGDFVQAHEADLAFEGVNEDIIAHEMIHHWFGDLVTCESWANLTLNEGFASFGEALWAEHKGGKDGGDNKMLNQLSSYLRSLEFNTAHPLIDYYHDDANDMFDAHSYSKGSLVLRMLRWQLGDAVFFRGIQKYLRDNAFQAVEADHLRLAMEAVSGIDLNPFFDLWFHTAGHPVLEVISTYDSLSQSIQIQCDQTQGEMGWHVPFTFPLSVRVYYHNGEVMEERYNIVESAQTISIPSENAPTLVLVDPAGMLLAEIDHPKSYEEYGLQMWVAEDLKSRREASDIILKNQDRYSQEHFNHILHDPDIIIRTRAIWQINDQNIPGFYDTLATMIAGNPDPRLLQPCLQRLGQTGDPAYADAIAQHIYPGQRNKTLIEAISALAKTDISRAVGMMQAFDGVADDPAMLVVNAELLSITGDSLHQEWFIEQLVKPFGKYFNDFLSGYGNYMMTQEDADPLISGLRAFAKNEANNAFNRYLATKQLITVRDTLTGDEREAGKKIDLLQTAINSIIEAETHPWLVRVYANFRGTE